jgi:hypothetical protein
MLYCDVANNITNNSKNCLYIFPAVTLYDFIIT